MGNFKIFQERDGIRMLVLPLPIYETKATEIYVNRTLFFCLSIPSSLLGSDLFATVDLKGGEGAELSPTFVVGDVDVNIGTSNQVRGSISSVDCTNLGFYAIP